MERLRSGALVRLTGGAWPALFLALAAGCGEAEPGELDADAADDGRSAVSGHQDGADENASVSGRQDETGENASADAAPGDEETGKAVAVEPRVHTVGDLFDEETRDGGMSEHWLSPTALYYPPGNTSPSSSCTGSGGEAGTTCGDISDAYVANAVNVGYYPFKIKSGVSTYLLTCDNPLKIKENLNQGQNVAAQSTRNPSCSNNPPLRPAVNGHVFVYARGSGNGGWVPSSALEWTGYTDQTCAAGPADVDFQIYGNPYDSCKPTVCHPDAKGYGGQSCKAVNGTEDGKSDCGGKRMNVTKTVSATDMYLRYAPLSTAVRYLHKNDKVKVLYDNLKGWSFVQVTYSSCPGLTPVGSRGWCQTDYLK